MFSNKSQHQIKMSKIITRYLAYIEELYQLLENNIEKINVSPQQLKKIRRS